MPGVITKTGNWCGVMSTGAGQGRPDTIYYYEKDTIVREERDETRRRAHDLSRDLRNGRIEKVEKDSSGQRTARPLDVLRYFARRRDRGKRGARLNGDGVADLWSYYDNGRLVRRDVNAPGTGDLV